MDNLKELIATFSTEDSKAFRVFINRQRKRKQRKDLELFNILQKEPKRLKPAEMVKRLATSNKEAYYAIRKRLIHQLGEFIVLKRMDEDTTTVSPIMGLISIARYLYDKKADRQAWNYLLKAEALATVNEQVDLLNTIYMLQLEHGALQEDKVLKHIIKKRRENKLRIDEEERAVIAHRLIRNQLDGLLRLGKPLDFNRVISKVLKYCELDETMMQRPKLLYNLIAITRSAYLRNKDFYFFEPYLIDQYNAVKNQHGFTKSTHKYKLHLLYMITHILYRNRKFVEARAYCAEFYKSMNRYNKSHYTLFYPKYILLLAAIKSHTNENAKAIEDLEALKQNKVARLASTTMLHLHLSLSVCYFNQNEIAQANETIMSIPHTDKWCEKKAGKEWLLKKHLIELLIQYELGNEDIALNRIRAIERYFGDFFKQARYSITKKYLTAIRDYINNPQEIDKIYKKIVVYFGERPLEQEDLQKMAFFAWLKSKRTQRNYYEVLLETVNLQSEENENRDVS
ncbi:MAG: hypothetical protein AB8G15_02330 [Saprospiraceae bacterium]